MSYFTKYHVCEQSARALLDPVRASLVELERRTRHFAERLNLEPGAEQSLSAAHKAIAQARAEVERALAGAKAGEAGAGTAK